MRGLERPSQGFKSKEDFVQSVRQEMLNVSTSLSHGFLKETAQYHFSKMGKFFRSQTLYEIGQIYHADLDKVFVWALASELMHEASLIHDDLQDKDALRRSQASVWKKFDSRAAINLGDFLLMLSNRVAAELSAPFSQALSESAMTLVQGQSDEMELNQMNVEHNKVLDLYRDCAESKTGGLFVSLTRGLSLIAQLPQKESDLLEEVSLHLGFLFQIQDDILDLFFDKRGGDVGSDIREGKVSFLVACHLKQHPEDFLMIKEILKKPRIETQKTDVEKIKNLLTEKGSLSCALAYFKKEKDFLLGLSLKSQNSQLHTALKQTLLQLCQPISPLMEAHEISKQP